MVVSGNLRYRIVGAYILPNDTTTSVYITAVLGCFSPHQKMILVGNLNLSLDSLETDRDIEIANILIDSRLLDINRHFKLRW